MNTVITGDISSNLSYVGSTVENSACTTTNINQLLSALPDENISVLTSILTPSVAWSSVASGKYRSEIPEAQASHYLELQEKYPMLSTSAIAMMALAQVMQDSLDGLMNEIDIQSTKVETMRKQNIDTNNAIQKQTEKMAKDSENRSGQIASGVNRSTTDIAEAGWKIFGIIAQLVVFIACAVGAFFTGGVSLMIFLAVDSVVSAVINLIANHSTSLKTQRNCSIALTFFSLNVFSEVNDVSLELGNINQETHDKNANAFMWADIALNIVVLVFSIGSSIYAAKSAVASGAAEATKSGLVMESGGRMLLSASNIVSALLAITNGIFSIQQSKLHKEIAEDKFKLSSLQATITFIKETLKDDNDYLSYLIKMFSQRASEVGTAWKQASDVMQVELEGKTQIARNI